MTNRREFPGPTLGEVAEAFVPPTVPTLIAGARTFVSLVQVVRERTSARGRRARREFEARLVPIANAAALLAVAEGRAIDIADGIVLFHEEISRGRPSLRQRLRRLDEIEGRLAKKSRTKAQTIVTMGVKAGRFKRRQDGAFIGPDAVLKGFLNRAKTRAASERRKREIERQKKFDAKLRGFAKKIVLPNIRGAKRRRT